MEQLRNLKVADIANRSEKFRELVLAIQDAETRIKEVVFNSFLTQEDAEVLVVRIVEDTIKRLPEEVHGMKVDKERFRRDLMRNVNHWMAVVKLTKSALDKGLPSIGYVADNEEAYREVATLFEKGAPRHEKYQEMVLHLTKELAKQMAEKPFKSSTVSFGGLEMRTNISLRAAVERQVRDQIHRSDVDAIISTNRFVWISSHADASKRCEPWQGRLYSTDGSSGEIDGHQYIPLEVATQSNIVTTRNGTVYNNSVLVGFNCRHYVIPYVPGTVPVIQYDKQIVARERKVTEVMRRMEREIIAEKTLHRLLVKADRNTLGLPRYILAKLRRDIRESYQAKQDYYKQFCHHHGRAYYPWRTRVLLDRKKRD